MIIIIIIVIIIIIIIIIKSLCKWSSLKHEKYWNILILGIWSLGSRQLASGLHSTDLG